MMKLLAIGDRLKHARAELQLTKHEMARRLGVAVLDLSAAERGEDALILAVVVGLALHFPALDTAWLLIGRGDLLLRESAPIGAGAELDAEALSLAQRLFEAELRRRSGYPAARLIEDQAESVALMYRTYMSHLRAFRAAGRAEAEARALARRECEQLAEREAEGSTILCRGAEVSR